MLQKPKRPPVKRLYLTILGRDQAEKCAFLSEWQISPKTFFNPFQKRALIFTSLKDKSFENTVGKGKTACHEQFFLFPQCFYLFFTCYENFPPFSSTLNCRLQVISSSNLYLAFFLIILYWLILFTVFKIPGFMGWFLDEILWITIISSFTFSIPSSQHVVQTYRQAHGRTHAGHNTLIIVPWPMASEPIDSFTQIH